MRARIKRPAGTGKEQAVNGQQTGLAVTLPASAADQASQRQAKAAALRKQRARIDTAEGALITELEAPAAPGDPAAQALRQRIRARFTDLFTERTRIEAELAALAAATTQDNDPALLNALPILGEAPARLIEGLLDAFAVTAVYNNDLHQVTINATLTDATPQAITGLLNDPRTDQATPARTPAPATKDHFSHLAADTGVHVMAPLRVLGLGNGTNTYKGCHRAGAPYVTTFPGARRLPAPAPAATGFPAADAYEPRQPAARPWPGPRRRSIVGRADQRMSLRAGTGREWYACARWSSRSWADQRS